MLVAAITAAVTGVSTGAADVGTRQIMAGLAGLVGRKRGRPVAESELLGIEPIELARELEAASDQDRGLGGAVQEWKASAAEIVPRGESRNSVSGVVRGPVTQIGDGAQISNIRIG